MKDFFKFNYPAPYPEISFGHHNFHHKIGLFKPPPSRGVSINLPWGGYESSLQLHIVSVVLLLKDLLNVDLQEIPIHLQIQEIMKHNDDAHLKSI